MTEHQSSGLLSSILCDDGSETLTTSLIRVQQKLLVDVSRYFMYKRNEQKRNLSKSFTFITNLIHLLLRETQMQINLSENVMLRFQWHDELRDDWISVGNVENFFLDLSFIRVVSFTSINKFSYIVRVVSGLSIIA